MFSKKKNPMEAECNLSEFKATLKLIQMNNAFVDHKQSVQKTSLNNNSHSFESTKYTTYSNFVTKNKITKKLILIVAKTTKIDPKRTGSI